MRKEQEKILARAKKYDMTDSQILMLSREDLTIKEITIIFDYFRWQQDINGNSLATEAERCIKLLWSEKNNRKQYLLLLKFLLPQYYFIEKDILIGSKKKNGLIKAYYFLRVVAQKYNMPDDSYEFCFDAIFSTYRRMLYLGFSSWHINTVLREMFRSKNKGYSYFFRYFSAEQPELIEDFLYNKKDSLFYYMAIQNENDMEYSLRKNKSFFHENYDYEKHKFNIFKKDYEKIFKVVTNDSGINRIKLDEDYYLKRKREKYPIIEKIVSFVNEKRSEFDVADGGKYQKWWLEEPELDRKIQQCYELLHTKFTINTTAFYFGIKINKETCFINISLMQYSTIIIGTNNKNGWITGEKVADKSFIIAPDGRLFKQTAKGKIFPLSVEDFYMIYQVQNFCGDFVGVLKAYLEEKNYLFKDIFHDMEECQCVIPLNMNEILQYHNKAELLCGKYKAARELPIRWNKQNINLSYLIIKAYNCVELGKSRQILIQQRNMSLIKNVSYAVKAYVKPYLFLEQILYRNILNYEKENDKNKAALVYANYRKEIEGEVQTNILPDEYDQWITEKLEEETGNDDLFRTIQDYIGMCRLTKKKVRLDIYSKNQLYNLHDRVATNQINYRKETGKVSIPKKSKFLHLREILPEDFEWITTRKRLILETELQHHCVWSYAENITKDMCAIYSFVDTNAEHSKDGIPKRYTVEFRQNLDKSYYVEQVQGKYDKVNANKMREYVQELLFRYQNAKEKGEKIFA